MRKRRSFQPIALILALTANACAHAENTTTAATVSDASPNQRQSAATAVQSFTSIEGSDLQARLEAASRLGRNVQTPFWSAYAFDVRPNVAIDPGVQEFHGSMSTVGDTAVFVGTTASGVTVETGNLAIFLLRDASPQVTRMEVYNLERKREYAGYPVYWMGRANNEESLNYLRRLSDSASLNTLGERAVLAISLHDDARVAPMLKTFIRSSPNQRIRSSSVYWLGQIGGEQQFLADIVRSDTEDKRLRRQAAHAIGESRERGALTLLQSLYDTNKDNELRRSIIQAAANNQEREAAFAFILKVATGEPQRELRRSAVRQLGHFEREHAVDELIKIYRNEADVEVKRAVLQSLAETKSLKAHALLLEVARAESNPELRRQAIHRLAERGEESVDELIKLFDSEKVPEVRRTILQAVSQIKNTRVEDKLFAVARDDASVDMRRQAIRLLGERAGKRSLDFLSATVESPDGNTDVQLQAVRAIGERKTDESVPILIKIAKTHPNQLVRKQAIRSLGESGDPRAVEFFREVLTN